MIDDIIETANAEALERLAAVLLTVPPEHLEQLFAPVAPPEDGHQVTDH